jgi:hypothetical protein
MLCGMCAYSRCYSDHDARLGAVLHRHRRQQHLGRQHSCLAVHLAVCVWLIMAFAHLCMCMCMCLRVCSRLRFVDLVLLYATCSEMGFPTDANPRNYSTVEPVDVEFKQLLWSFVGVVTGVTSTSTPQRSRVSLSGRKVLPPPRVVNAEVEAQAQSVLDSVR